MDFLTADAEGVARAAALLRAGGVVAFPTDTVYGLAARAGDPRAVRKIYEIKGRSLSQPLVLMVANASQLGDWVEPGAYARKLMERWWPGPLTLVLPATRRVKPPLGAGSPRTLGVRIPDHPDALALLRAAGEPLATTSANVTGRPPAMTPVEAALEGVAAVIDGGRAPGGVPSTVLDVTGPRPRTLRAGPVTI
ncbi:MAG TPA: L-threonylcarbamoyladenylate synthase [Candidatus Acidoferrales bacterium]|nr:L-threonylcarbamoyladenylate synthase [Candidatus Acidoferrales bacterium]